MLRDSSSWTSLFRRCYDVVVANMVIRSPLDWPNGTPCVTPLALYTSSITHVFSAGDGMDVESGGNITIQHCNIATGDDAVAMRSGNCNAMRTPWPEAIISALTNVKVLRSHSIIMHTVLLNTSASISPHP